MDDLDRYLERHNVASEFIEKFPVELIQAISIKAQKHMELESFNFLKNGYFRTLLVYRDCKWCVGLPDETRKIMGVILFCAFEEFDSIIRCEIFDNTNFLIKFIKKSSLVFIYKCAYALEVVTEKQNCKLETSNLKCIDSAIINESFLMKLVSIFDEKFEEYVKFDNEVGERIKLALRIKNQYIKCGEWIDEWVDGRSVVGPCFLKTRIEEVLSEYGEELRRETDDECDAYDFFVSLHRQSFYEMSVESGETRF